MKIFYKGYLAIFLASRVVVHVCYHESIICIFLYMTIMTLLRSIKPSEAPFTS